MTRRLAVGISVVWVPLAFLFDGTTTLLLPVRLGGGGDVATTIGLVSFVGLAAALAFQPLAGMAGDRLRHRLDRRAFIALAAVPAIGGLWLLAVGQGLAAIAAGYIAVQLGASGIQAAQQTLIPEHVGRPAMGRAGGMKVAFDVGGAFLAFLVLGALLAGGDARPAAVATTVVLGLAIAIAVALVPRAAYREARAPSGGRLLPPGLGRLVVARFLFLLGTYAVGRFLLLLVAERLGIEPVRAADEAGGLLALFTLATAVAAIAFGTAADRWGRARTMTVGIALSVAGIAALGVPAGIAGVVVGGLLMAAGSGAFLASNWAATTALAPAADAGRLMGIANFGTGGAAACAGLLGPLVDRAGFGPALAVAAVATALAVVPLARSADRASPVEQPA